MAASGATEQPYSPFVLAYDLISHWTKGDCSKYTFLAHCIDKPS